MQTCNIKSIMILPNGLVAVFNKNDKQVPMLQGKWSDKKIKNILLYLMKRYPEIEVTGDINTPKQKWENEQPFYLPYLLHALEINNDNN